jgi:hypothetical protein
MLMMTLVTTRLINDHLTYNEVNCMLMMQTPKIKIVRGLLIP